MIYQLFLIAFLIVIAGLVPGPNFILVASRSMEFGRKASLWTVFGLALGAATYAMLGLLGLGAVLTAHAQLFRAVKLVGALYVIWLGIRALITATDNGLGSNNEMPEFSGVSETTKLRLNRPYLVWEAWVLQICNPETILFFIALFASVITMEIDGMVGLILIITVFASAFLLYGTLATGLSTGALRRFYNRFGYWISILFGALMIVLGIVLGIAAIA